MTVANSLRILTAKNPQFAKCPHCQSKGALYRSRSRNIYEQAVRSLTFYKTYRCKECGWRGFRSTIGFAKNSMKSFYLYVVLVIITAFVARFVITTFVVK